ncbi:MAG: T9SS type A sorting domain-containing protein [Rhodothermales bacterium]|nr:T9SS type A sorting domain-containing protein [Rhodothermales bacterium]
MKAILLIPLAIVIGLSLTLSGDLPTQTSTLFAGSGRCESCHSASSDLTGAMRDTEGSDISPISLWRSTVMANAAKDPIWQAKVEAEVSVFPTLQSIIEDKCTTCHMPMARTEAIFSGAQSYAMADGLTDPLAMDGVSCTVCHQIQSGNLGLPASFSGGFAIDDRREIYGPYDDVQSAVMEASVNYSAVQGLHLTQSALCASCHTLFTPTIDNSGQPAGEIAEQTTYLEWRNSSYPDNNVQCQTCHMPEVEVPTAISTVPGMLPARSPFSRHYFVGGNRTLLEILKENGDEIGVTADTVLVDSTLARTVSQLRNRTAELKATYSWPNPDTLEVTLDVTNKTGHKFPTGFPSRRAWLDVLLTDGSGTPVFQSGRWNQQTAEIEHLDDPFEPHYDVVSAEEQIVVYQSLMGDVDGQLTWTLLRGADYLKDNRIPPAGFVVGGAFYDSTSIVGEAAADPNFNHAAGIEGSGSDRVVFRIGGVNQMSTYSLSARLLYQSLSRSFVDDLYQYSGPQVDRFKSYFDETGGAPVTVDSLMVAITSTSVDPTKRLHPRLEVGIYPNPVSDRVTFAVSGADEPVEVVVFNLLGREVARLVGTRDPDKTVNIEWDVPSLPDGVYLFLASSGTSTHSGKIVLLR